MHVFGFHVIFNFSYGFLNELIPLQDLTEALHNELSPLFFFGANSVIGPPLLVCTTWIYLGFGSILPGNPPCGLVFCTLASCPSCFSRFWVADWFWWTSVTSLTWYVARLAWSVPSLAWSTMICFNTSSMLTPAGLVGCFPCPCWLYGCPPHCDLYWGGPWCC